jgi:hypothetical protein
MTKKDYELIADSIKQFRYKIDELADTEIDQSTVSLLVGWLASDLEKDNSKFNENKFLNACM